MDTSEEIPYAFHLSFVGGCLARMELWQPFCNHEEKAKNILEKLTHTCHP